MTNALPLRPPALPDAATHRPGQKAESPILPDRPFVGSDSVLTKCNNQLPPPQKACNVLKKHLFQGDELFDIVDHNEAWPGNPAWANLCFRQRKIDPENLRGPGVYGIFFNNQLVYLGKFLGHLASPFSQNIGRARWDKHLGTMTLRGRQVSWPGQTLDRIVRDFPLAPPVQDMRVAVRDTLCRDRGMQSSYNRFRFGNEHWAQFSSLDTADLSCFSFLYIQVQNTPLAVTLGTGGIRAAVSGAEDILVSMLRPRCNGRISYDSAELGHEMQHVAEQVAAVLTAKLLNTPTVSVPTARPRVHDQLEVEPNHAVDDNEARLSAEELWYEKFSEGSAARHTVEIIANTIGDSCEVHYTYTAGGDMRIRATRNDGKARNVFTMRYRARTADFVCRAFASLECCQLAGFEAQSALDPLENGFVFKPETNRLANLLHVIACSREGFGP
jgi:hypothetical protein